METFWTDDEVYRFQKQYDLLRGINPVSNSKDMIKKYRENGSLVNIVKEKKKKTIETKTITKIISQYFNISEEILTSNLIKGVIKYRQIYQYFLNKYTDMTLNEIGKHCNYTFISRHSAILSNVKKIRWRYQVEPGFRSEIDKIDELLIKNL